MTVASRDSRRKRFVNGRPPVAATATHALPPIASLVAGIPDSLRQELFDRFNDTVSKWRRLDWEGALLNAGKFCEVVYTVLKGRADGSYPERAVKPKNMVLACTQLETADDARMGGRALRLQVPRALVPLYDIRSNRGTGHAGAEVDPNRMDADYAVHACRWILGDLIRAYHNLDPEAAEAAVRRVTQRDVSAVWKLGGFKQVLVPGTALEIRLEILLYDEGDGVDVDLLRRWSGYQNTSRFREILREMMANALLVFDEEANKVTLSPLGERDAEAWLDRNPIARDTTIDSPEFT